MYWMQTGLSAPPPIEWQEIVPWIIAISAVFSGPFIQLKIAKKQIESATQLAKLEISRASERTHKQVVAPMRQCAKSG